MRRIHKKSVILLIVVMIAVAVVTLWLHTQTTPSKTIHQNVLISEFLGKNISPEAVDYTQFCNTDDGADFCLVLNDVSYDNFIKTIDFCCGEVEDSDGESIYTYYQEKFPFLQRYKYSDCIHYVGVFHGCEYSKGHSFFERTYETHHPIYFFSFKKDGTQKLIVCSSLPYGLDVLE